MTIGSPAAVAVLRSGDLRDRNLKHPAPVLTPSSSDSSLSTNATTPVATEQSPWSSKSSYCAVGSSGLEGWLQKRHAHDKMLGSNWGRRYAFVHEERGLLIMSKKPDKSRPFWHKDHTCLPLADCTIAHDTSNERNTFVITCNHEKLVLRAAHEDECDRWVSTLTLLRQGAEIKVAS